MVEERITRRRILRGEGEGDIVHETDDGTTTGLGVALAVALAIIAVLALFALARGVFTPPAATPTPTTIEVQPGIPID